MEDEVLDVSVYTPSKRVNTVGFSKTVPFYNAFEIGKYKLLLAVSIFSNQFWQMFLLEIKLYYNAHS